MAHDERGPGNGEHHNQGNQGNQGLGPFEMAALGTANVGCILGGGALGWLIDSQLGTMPVFVLAGSAAGMALGVIGSYQKIRKYLND